LVHTYELIFF